MSSGQINGIRAEHIITSTRAIASLQNLQLTAEKAEWPIIRLHKRRTLQVLRGRKRDDDGHPSIIHKSEPRCVDGRRKVYSWRQHRGYIFILVAVLGKEVHGLLALLPAAAHKITTDAAVTRRAACDSFNDTQCRFRSAGTRLQESDHELYDLVACA